MYVARKVTECDFSHKRYPEPVDGCAVVTPGATGRWCEVLHIGPEEMAAGNIKPISVEEAYKYIEENCPGQYADF